VLSLQASKESAAAISNFTAARGNWWCFYNNTATIRRTTARCFPSVKSSQESAAAATATASFGFVLTCDECHTDNRQETSNTKHQFAIHLASSVVAHLRALFPSSVFVCPIRAGRHCDWNSLEPVVQIRTHVRSLTFPIIENERNGSFC
jgi:hypothetical protein